MRERREEWTGINNPNLPVFYSKPVTEEVHVAAEICAENQRVLAGESKFPGLREIPGQPGLYTVVGISSQ